VGDGAVSWRDPRLWLGLASLVLVGALVWRDVERGASPGPLSSVHAREDQLAGAEGCDRCHGRGEAGFADACASCHGDVATDLAQRSGLHGALDPEVGAACGRCHLEHLGDELPLAGRLAFERAGFGTRADFDHGHVEFGLSGAHDALGCEDCHPRAGDLPAALNGSRFGEAAQSCASCHEDPHRGSYSDDCARCHGQERPFAELGGFVHSEALPLVGAHGEQACDACHAPSTPTSVVALASAAEPPWARRCGDCHHSPHAESFLAQVAAQLGEPPQGSCAACHDPTHGDFVEGARLEPELHRATGFPLEPPHDEQTCKDCHGAGLEPAADFATRHPGRAPGSCELCHADVHGGQFASGPFEGNGCRTCHGTAAFRPHVFTARQHARTAFVLEGTHREVACEECHRRAESTEEPLRFAAAPEDCVACHADVHGDGLLGDDVQDCASCHRPTRFDDLLAGSFDHDARTRFALDGVHAGLDCEACHQPGSEQAGEGRRLGRISAAFREAPAPGGCVACHEDVHRGAFEVGDSAVGCDSCHGTQSFRQLHGEGFDHGRWTGFPLGGAHDAIACQACHGAGPAEGTRALGLVSERYGRVVAACADCHADPHGGRFLDTSLAGLGAEPVACDRCHGSEAFDRGAREVFDHRRWTGFALDGGHGGLACADCHIVRRPGVSLGAVRGARCADCHADPHVGQFAERGRTDCARCHVATTAFRPARFDHDTQSRFPLDERHVDLACGACHRPWPLPGGGETVRYKPLGIRCDDCHRSGPPERGVR